MSREIIGSPLRARILLHIHCICEPIKNETAPAVKGTVTDFLEQGVIVEDDGASGYKTTDLGEAWVSEILRTPLPRKVFLDKHGKII